MKKILIALVLPAILASMAFTIGEPLTIGSSMPKADVKMLDMNGKMISIKDVAGTNGTLVMFSCNTCPYVIKNQERTLAINDYAKKMKLGVIVLNSNEAYRGGEDSPEAMKAYAKEQKYNWSYVVYHGAIDDNPSDASAVGRQHLKEAINELVMGKTISVKETKSVGCSIKRNKP